jgi:hypothetical protein
MAYTFPWVAHTKPVWHWITSFLISTHYHALTVTAVTALRFLAVILRFLAVVLLEIFYLWLFPFGLFIVFMLLCHMTHLT